jgi:sugar/nucleoside kinase (ribokinase family)
MTLPDPQGPAGQVDWQRLLARVLPHVDIFTPSVEELLYMLAREEWERLAGEDDVAEAIPEALVEDLAGRAVALGAQTVLLKLGQRGALLRTAEEQVRLQPSPIEPERICNACGAGDAAVAGLLTAILRGETPEAAGRMGMIAGRDSLCGADTTAGLRSWEEMAADARG